MSLELSRSRSSSSCECEPRSYHIYYTPDVALSSTTTEKMNIGLQIGTLYMSACYWFIYTMVPLIGFRLRARYGLALVVLTGVPEIVLMFWALAPTRRYDFIAFFLLSVYFPAVVVAMRFVYTDEQKTHDKFWETVRTHELIAAQRSEMDVIIAQSEKSAVQLRKAILRLRHDLTLAQVVVDRVMSRSGLDCFKICFDQIKVGRVIGEGAFGK